MEDIIKNHMKIGIFIKILVMYIFYQQKQDIKNIIIKIRIKNIIMDKEKYYNGQRKILLDSFTKPNFYKIFI